MGRTANDPGNRVSCNKLCLFDDLCRGMRCGRTTVFMQRAAHTRDAKAIGQSSSPIEASVSVGNNRKMSLKTGDGKPLTANMTSNKKLQLKFRSREFLGEYFYYSGDLFLIYNSGQLARLNYTSS